MEINELVHGFENGTLTSDQWTHEAHLTIALWYVYHFGMYKAITLFRIGNIRKNKVVDSQYVASKYHETMTVFWVIELDKFKTEHSELHDFNLLREAMCRERKFFDKGYINQFYSEKLIVSAYARAMYVTPDLV